MTKKTKLKIYQGDITALPVDAIVNAANPSLLGGGGVDGAIHRAAGPGLRAECAKIQADSHGRRCLTGEAVLTGGHNLRARYVIHTVGPIYSPRRDVICARLLRNCYVNSLLLAKEKSIKTIAYPGISTGAYGYPLDDAAVIATQTVKNFIAEFPDALEEVTFAVFGNGAKMFYEALV